MDIELQNLKEELAASQQKLDQCARLGTSCFQICRIELNYSNLYHLQSQHFLMS